MKIHRILFLAALAACASKPPAGDDLPKADVDFYLTGSMGSEFVPERVLKALVRTFPELFPGGNFAAYGVLYDGETALGLSRRRVDHLGGQMSVGINCASCHVAEIQGPTTVRVLGRPGHFDVFSFLGAIAVAMSKTPEAMDKFLHMYLSAGDPSGEQRKLLTNELMRQKDAIAKALTEKPQAGILHDIDPKDLELNGKMLHAQADLAPLVRALLKVLTNSRTCLGLPDPLPPPPPTLPGPGRTDAFGVLSIGLFGVVPKVPAPVKYGFVWNLSQRRWVHWDGNMDQPIARNIAASLGLGCPSDGAGRRLDFSLVQRQTDVSENIRAPRYPWAIDSAAAARGWKTYQAMCASCHDTGEDKRLYEVGTDPNRIQIFDDEQARLHNTFLQNLKIEGYKAKPGTYRSTRKYWANDMAGVWARSPYLHNGSVRTMQELLLPAARRASKFKVGSRVYDAKAMGFADDGSFEFDTSLSGNSNRGHEYGTQLSDADKRDLIEYLKTR